MVFAVQQNNVSRVSSKGITLIDIFKTARLNEEEQEGVHILTFAGIVRIDPVCPAPQRVEEDGACQPSCVIYLYGFLSQNAGFIRRYPLFIILRCHIPRSPLLASLPVQVHV